MTQALGKLVDMGCGDSHYLGIACMVQIPFGELVHRGDHRAWSTEADDDQPWVLVWPNQPKNLNLWRALRCRP